jgi:hypothetical protein
MDFQETATASYNATKGELTITVIKPGTSKNNRHYPAAVLKRSAKIFEGARMFADHQTDSEVKARPEGSVNQWVATLTKTWAEADGTIKGAAVVIDPVFKTKLENLARAGCLNQMGISIRATGRYSDTPGPGGSKLIESLDSCRSVDFVTFAGAGGSVDAIESFTPTGEEVKDGLHFKKKTAHSAILRSKHEDFGLALKEAAIMSNLDISFLEGVYGGVDPRKRDLAAGFRAIGLSEADAERAAKIENRNLFKQFCNR